MSYNWAEEYKNLWWVIHSHEFDPKDTKLEKLLEDVFDIAWCRGEAIGVEAGYDECLVEYGI